MKNFSANPESVLRDVFAFLGVKQDVAINTSVRYNAAGVPKSRKLYTLLDNFIREPSPLQQRIRSLVPVDLRIAWASKVKSVLLRPVSLNPQIQAELTASFAEDVGKLEELLERDLLCWHYPQPSMAQ